MGWSWGNIILSGQGIIDRYNSNPQRYRQVFHSVSMFLRLDVAFIISSFSTFFDLPGIWKKHRQGLSARSRLAHTLSKLDQHVRAVELLEQVVKECPWGRRRMVRKVPKCSPVHERFALVQKSPMIVVSR